ncbi:OmpA family protein, partial [Sorangium cellulosum]|uniref:OmpA family protein n=1 Tax=Sorangium cellulosum TaxID=56 RepID=UPI001F2A03EA
MKLNEKIAFAAGKADIEPASQELLADIARVIKENPQVQFVEVAAYSEKVGSDYATVTLTKKRADAVVKALVALGVEKNRMRPAGYGAHCASDAGETEEAKEKNRRVEIKIMRSEGKDTGVELACAAAVTKGLKPAGVPATAPKSAAKASDAKPVDLKPADAKPAAATKPAEAKPADAKPADAKPADAKPAAAATKPADAKPADTKPAETKPASV